MIHVIATVEIADGKRDQFLETCRANIATVQAEDGCIEYGPAIDAATDITLQPPRRDNVVTIVEKWRDLQALKAHLAAPHMATYRSRVKDIVKGVSLQVLQPV